MSAGAKGVRPSTSTERKHGSRTASPPAGRSSKPWGPNRYPILRRSIWRRRAEHRENAAASLIQIQFAGELNTMGALCLKLLRRVGRSGITDWYVRAPDGGPDDETQ